MDKFCNISSGGDIGFHHLLPRAALCCHWTWSILHCYWTEQQVNDCHLIWGKLLHHPIDVVGLLMLKLYGIEKNCEWGIRLQYMPLIVVMNTEQEYSESSLVETKIDTFQVLLELSWCEHSGGMFHLPQHTIPNLSSLIICLISFLLQFVKAPLMSVFFPVIKNLPRGNLMKMKFSQRTRRNSSQKQMKFWVV